jgi:hypothetical protein
MSSCIACKKPFLKEVHKKQRLAWANVARHWGDKEWTKILSLDAGRIIFFKKILKIL